MHQFPPFFPNRPRILHWEQPPSVPLKFTTYTISTSVVEPLLFLSIMVGDTLMLGEGDVIWDAGSNLKRVMAKWYCDVQFGELSRQTSVYIPDDVKDAVQTIYSMGWYNILNERNPDAYQAYNWIVNILGPNSSLRYQAHKGIKEEYGVY